ncbi:MAG TPA: aromatic-ring-hydroxylating dioxygenase subunit beta, partial [Actinomycetota bacterium]
YWKVPRARTLHSVTNVLVTSASEERVEARSKFTVFRTDREGYTMFHASGEYFDEFDRTPAGLLLRRHDAVIDMNVLPDDFTELL